MVATKSKRKKPANGQKPKETEEEDDKKGTTDLIDGSLHWYDSEAKKCRKFSPSSAIVSRRL